MDEAAIQAAAIEKRRKRIEIGGELNVPKLSAYVRLERNAWAARERKKAKAAEAKAGGETMPPDVEEAVARAGCTQDARRKRQRRRDEAVESAAAAVAAAAASFHVIAVEQQQRQGVQVRREIDVEAAEMAAMREAAQRETAQRELARCEAERHREAERHEAAQQLEAEQRVQEQLAAARLAARREEAGCEEGGREAGCEEAERAAAESKEERGCVAEETAAEEVAAGAAQLEPRLRRIHATRSSARMSEGVRRSKGAELVRRKYASMASMVHGSVVAR